MIDNILYKLRILILMIYVKITMIGYESKQKKIAGKFVRRT